MHQVVSSLAKTFSKSRLPIYAQVAALLRQRIDAREWGPGDRLPNLDAIQAEFDVARVTARQAVGLLEAEGLVWRKQGRGTFVADRLPDQRWLSVGTDWSSLMSTLDGATFEVLLRGKVAAPPRLEPSDGRPAPGYHRIKRVHSHNGRPYCVIDLYLAERVFALCPEEFESQLALQMISDLRDQGRITIGMARQSLVLGTADVESADSLGMEIGAPVALVRRTMKDKEDCNFYLADVTYRGDFIKLDFDLLAHNKD